MEHLFSKILLIFFNLTSGSKSINLLTCRESSISFIVFISEVMERIDFSYSSMSMHEFCVITFDSNVLKKPQDLVFQGQLTLLVPQ